MLARVSFVARPLHAHKAARGPAARPLGTVGLAPQQQLYAQREGSSSARMLQKRDLSCRATDGGPRAAWRRAVIQTAQRQLCCAAWGPPFSDTKRKRAEQGTGWCGAVRAAPRSLPPPLRPASRSTFPPPARAPTRVRAHAAAASPCRPSRSGDSVDGDAEDTIELEIRVQGMTCGGCRCAPWRILCAARAAGCRGRHASSWLEGAPQGQLAGVAWDRVSFQSSSERRDRPASPAANTSTATATAAAPPPPLARSTRVADALKTQSKVKAVQVGDARSYTGVVHHGASCDNPKAIGGRRRQPLMQQ